MRTPATAGELKHGPLALVDSKMPVIAVAPNNELLGKLKANLAEVSARGGKLFVFADESITVDANHPLAGQALNFDIELVEIGGGAGIILPT